MKKVSLTTTLQIKERKTQLKTMRNYSPVLRPYIRLEAPRSSPKNAQQVLLGPPNDAVGNTPFEPESVDWPRSTMRPIAAWYTFIAVYREEHGQLVLGVESRYKIQQGLAVDMSFCGTSSPATAGLQPIMLEKQLTTRYCQISRRQQHCCNIQLKHRIKNQK
jgi:hypothetical protein